MHLSTFQQQDTLAQAKSFKLRMWVFWKGKREYVCGLYEPPRPKLTLSFILRVPSLCTRRSHLPDGKLIQMTGPYRGLD